MDDKTKDQRGEAICPKLVTELELEVGSFIPLLTVPQLPSIPQLNFSFFFSGLPVSGGARGRWGCVEGGILQSTGCCSAEARGPLIGWEGGHGKIRL